MEVQSAFYRYILLTLITFMTVASIVQFAFIKNKTESYKDKELYLWKKTNKLVKDLNVQQKEAAQSFEARLNLVFDGDVEQHIGHVIREHNRIHRSEGRGLLVPEKDTINSSPTIVYVPVGGPYTVKSYKFPEDCRVLEMDVSREGPWYKTQDHVTPETEYLNYLKHAAQWSDWNQGPVIVVNNYQNPKVDWSLWLKVQEHDFSNVNYGDYTMYSKDFLESHTMFRFEPNENREWGNEICHISNKGAVSFI